MHTQEGLQGAADTTPPAKPLLCHAAAKTGRAVCVAMGAIKPTCLEPRQQDRSSDFRLPTHVSNHVSTPIQDGTLRRACTALIQEAPIQATSAVIDELWALHPDDALLADLHDIVRWRLHASPRK